MSLLNIVDDVSPSIFEQLEQGHVAFGSIAVKDEVGRWPASILPDLRLLIMHALSNAADHGYVFPLRRGESLPPAAFRIDAERLNFGFRICIRDQGGGLRWDKLQELAKERGFVPTHNRPLSDVLFQDGVSTSERLTLSSGRGIGLAAIQEVCQKRGGEATLLDNDEGRGTLLLIEWPEKDLALATSA